LAGHPGHGVNNQSGQPQGQATWEDGDFLDEGYVTNDDLNAAVGAVKAASLGQLPNLGYAPNFNSPVTPAFGGVSAVPEPATLSLLFPLAIALGMLWRRRSVSRV